MEIDFDLSPIPPSERFEFWHDVGSLVYRPVRLATSLSTPLKVQAKIRPSTFMMLGRMASSEQVFERTERMINSDHIDSFQLVLLEHGSVDWSTQGNDFHAQAGDLLLLDNHEISYSTWTAHQQIYAVLPRDLVAGAGWHGPSNRVLRSGSPCTTILSHYLYTMWATHQPESLSSTQKLAQGMATLMCLYFTESAPLLETVSTPEPIKETIQRWINQKLHITDLDASLICSAFYMSRSTLYELFKPEGGIRTYIQECRLERARLILETPHCEASISELARQLGFTSLSSFSRSFRDRRGLTPRGVRKRALDEAEADERVTPAINQPIHSKQLSLALKNYYNTVREISKS